ncbi:hypothetical protein BJ878DRAFT_97044 [Calycina marina]|uniref:2EXR domain-containing protein n=1 Tax=Calycina marina TaxID=1763456 RepID=A0A9P7Z2A3_9HELO|nr:hypothetical protein BJ878DRAFT_97044 [Calycina marina]
MHPDHALFFRYHRHQHCSVSVFPPLPTITERFMFFSLLPPELRLKIWHTIAPELQAVELFCMFVSSNMQTGGSWFTHNKPPILFRVCSESRALAFFEYEQLLFSRDQVNQRWQTLYINWERDSICFC